MEAGAPGVRAAVDHASDRAMIEPPREPEPEPEPRQASEAEAAGEIRAREREQQRDRERKRLAEIFGEVLPDSTRDDRDDAAPDSRDADLLRDVPPHHG